MLTGSARLPEPSRAVTSSKDTCPAAAARTHTRPSGSTWQSSLLLLLLSLLPLLLLASLLLSALPQLTLNANSAPLPQLSLMLTS
jgi:hypothetical protein